MNHLWLLQRHRCNDLVDDHLSDNFLTHCLIKRCQEALTQAADIPLAHRNIFFSDDGVAFQRPHHGDDIAEKLDLGGHEHGPGRRTLATNTHGDPANRTRTFQRGCQILVAGIHPHARVELLDLYVVTPVNLVGCQIVFYCELKKPLGDADKLFRQCEILCTGEVARAAKAQQSDCAQKPAGF